MTLVGLLASLLVGGCDPDEDASDGLGRLSAEAVAAAAEPAPGAGELAVKDGASPEPLDGAVAPSEGLAPDPTVDPASTAMRPAWPPTELPLALLATLGSRDPDKSRATIRDDDSGVIASYRVGDHVREDVEVLAIEDGLVELRRAGEVEYLGVSAVPVELSADDVFYPDLVADLHLSGSMADAVQMPPAPEYTLKADSFSWGTPRVIATLRDAIRAYARGRQVPRVHIGDISRREGGPFPPHISHQEGRDVDIAYVLTNPRARFGDATVTSLDRDRTWALVQALIDSDAVLYIFMDYEVQRLLYEHALAEGHRPEQLDRIFQYPHGRRAAQGVIRHWTGHRDHFHVRFVP